MSSDESVVQEVEQDLDIIQEGEEAPTEDVIQVERENNDDDDEEKVVKPKRLIRNPQPKLNDQTLSGPRGIAAVESYFERVKFKGHGYEEQDLNVLLKTYEYWCHRLFPRYPFEECVAKIEKLGSKKSVQTHIKRIRMDILLDVTENISLNNDDEDAPGTLEDNRFDQLLPENNASEEPEELVITEEQLERIRQNQERAAKLRQERLQKIRAKAQLSLEESNSFAGNTQNSATNENSFPTAEESLEINSVQHVDNQEDIDVMLAEINSDVCEKSSEESNNFARNTQNSATNEDCFPTTEESLELNSVQHNEEDIDVILAEINSDVCEKSTKSIKELCNNLQSSVECRNEQMLETTNSDNVVDSLGMETDELGIEEMLESMNSALTEDNKNERLSKKIQESDKQPGDECAKKHTQQTSEVMDSDDVEDISNEETDELGIEEMLDDMNSANTD